LRPKAKTREASGVALREFVLWARDYVSRVNQRWREQHPDDPTEFVSLPAFHVGVLREVDPDAPKTNSSQAGRILGAVFESDPERVKATARQWILGIHANRTRQP
jgi:hypothetical protein